MVLYDSRYRDFHPCFAHAAWSEDSRMLSVFVSNCYDRTGWRATYDLNAMRPGDQKAGEALLLRSLGAQYGGKAGHWLNKPLQPLTYADYLRWASSKEGTDAFNAVYRPWAIQSP